jgi:hypothetical protein
MTQSFQVLSSDTVWGILIRFAINLVFLIILIGLIYFRSSKKEKFLFTFFLIGIIVFLVCSIMKRVNIQLGVAFGLFAIFGILRLRTRNFGVKDMAYLFTTIGLSVINALGMMVMPFAGILTLNAVVLLSVFILEEFLQRNLFKKHRILYDNLGLLLPDKKTELLSDISAKTGRKIIKVKIRSIDIKKAVADLEIFFREQ